jgi:hypothetical protein
MSWNSPVPLLTECFELCTLRLAPLLFFWALFALLLPRLLRPAPNSTSKRFTFSSLSPADATTNALVDTIASSPAPEILRPPRLSSLTLVKFAMIGLLFLVLLVEIGTLVRLNDGDLALASILLPTLEALSCISIAALMLLHHKRLYLTSPHLFCVWFFESGVSLVLLYGYIMHFVLVCLFWL